MPISLTFWSIFGSCGKMLKIFIFLNFFLKILLWLSLLTPWIRIRIRIRDPGSAGSAFFAGSGSGSAKKHADPGSKRVHIQCQVNSLSIIFLFSISHPNDKWSSPLLPPTSPSNFISLSIYLSLYVSLSLSHFFSCSLLKISLLISNLKKTSCYQSVGCCKPRCKGSLLLK